MLGVHQDDSAFYRESEAQEGVLCAFWKGDEVAKKVDHSCMVATCVIVC